MKTNHLEKEMKNESLMRVFHKSILALVFSLLVSFSWSCKGSAEPPVYDIVIYGGSSAGVVAAVQAKRMGKTVAIINPYSFLGGMTASGLNSTDASNPATISGITHEFFASMRQKIDEEAPKPEIPVSLLAARGQYIPMEPVNTWKDFARVFEPHVAEQAFNEMISNADFPVFHNEKLDLENGVIFNGSRITGIRTVNGKEFHGKMFIDATYEGDLMAMANVTYIVGRESNTRYNETLNGFQLVGSGDLSRIADFGDEDHFIKDVDPYIIPGEPESGLLPWISSTRLENGTADHRVQAYNYRVILSDDPDNRIPFNKPESYKEVHHELLLRNFEAGDERIPGRFAEIPNGKIDWNSYGAVGTDMAGANIGYAEADHITRARIEREHEIYTKGHLWTLANHPRVPVNIRMEMQRWGYAKDEFQENNNFPYMLYVREARRMVSDYVMTERNCLHKRVAPDPIAIASFSMDSHVVQYVVNNEGFVEREGVFNKKVAGPYGVSYRSIIPKKGECPNLFVPICLSASHVGYGSIRMEPVFMNLAQAAATAASIAIDEGIDVQQVRYQKLKEHLQKDGVIFFAPYDPESRWGNSITKFDQWDSVSMPQPGGILLLGSSSFTLWKDVQDYFPDKHIVNRGFGGSQMSDLLYFKERLIPPYQPKQIVVFVGGNDIAYGDEPQDIFKEGKKLVSWTREQFPDVQFVFLSTKPSPKRWELKDKMLELNKLLISFAEENDFVDYVDIWHPMIDVDGQPINNNYIEDSLHLNDKGYKLWQKAMEPYLDE